MISLIIFTTMAYLLGSLSSAVIVCKLCGLADPRIEGSKNPGTTNVLRLGGKIPALMTLLGDFLKGLLPVLMAQMAGLSAFFTGIVAVAALLGHVFPLFFGFQGGKGVATSMGAFFALSPLVGLLIGGCWLAVAFASRYSSLAALISALFAPLAMLLTGNGAYLLPTLFIAAVLIWRHTDNINRLRAGTESKIAL